MDSFQNKLPEWALRLGFGFSFLYSGLDLVRHPTGWYWAVRPLPAVMQNTINNSIGIDQYLRMQGAVELIFAVVFFSWFVPRRIVRIVSVLVALEMTTILLLIGLSGDTFRDIGLLGASIALSILFFKNPS